jgi:hypothetical protein
MTAKEELAALKKKVEELEAKLSPPKPFVSKPYEPIDWTACLQSISVRRLGATLVADVLLGRR